VRIEASRNDHAGMALLNSRPILIHDEQSYGSYVCLAPDAK